MFVRSLGPLRDLVYPDGRVCTRLVRFGKQNKTGVIVCLGDFSMLPGNLSKFAEIYIKTNGKILKSYTTRKESSKIRFWRPFSFDQVWPSIPRRKVEFPTN